MIKDNKPEPKRKPRKPKDRSLRTFEYVCHYCGITYGKWYRLGEYHGPPDWCSTFHMGTCSCCGEENVAVTEERDYGYLDTHRIKLV